MKICVLGGTGFIGSHIVSVLFAHGHQVIIGCRDTQRARMIFPNAEVFSIIAENLDHHLVEALQGCDAVINTIGVLGKPGTSIAKDAHIQLVQNLVHACQSTNTRRIVHISALSLEDNLQSEYANTKLEGEKILQKSGLEVMILRTSFVYSTGCYGGSSALRGLCAMPWAVFLPNGGLQKFQPVWANDLAEVSLKACVEPLPENVNSQILQMGGPEIFTFAEILQKTRRWLGMKSCKTFSMPMPIVRMMGKIGDYFPLWGFSTAVVSQLKTDFFVSESDVNSLGVKLHSMDEAYQTHPSFVQDRWHGKLFLARPILALILAIIWIGSAISGFLVTSEELKAYFPQFLLSTSLPLIMIYVFSCIDLYFAFRILSGKWSKQLWILQMILVVIYTIGLTCFMPSLWLGLFGPLLKNLSVIGLIATMLCVMDDR